MSNEGDGEPSLEERWLNAADAGQVEVLTELLRAHPHLINVRASFQNLKASTALHVCAWRNRSMAAEFLLANGADVDIRDEAGLTPLQIDILRVCMEKMRPIPLLRSRCIDVSSPVAFALFKRKLVKDRSSYEHIDTSTLEVLLRHGASIDTPSQIGENALFVATEDGLIKHVRLLLDFGADALVVDRNGKTLLEIAAEHGYADITQLLIERHPELIHMAGVKSIRSATRHDFHAVVSTLYAHVQAHSSSTDVVKLNGELLLMAVEYDAPTTARFLLEQPQTDRTVCDPASGCSVVLKACRLGRTDMLSLLLEHGAPGNGCMADGSSAFHVALQEHSYGAIEILAGHGIDINALNDAQECPLVYGTRHGFSIESLELLIAHGANYVFPTRALRDEFAPRLASWLQGLCSSERMSSMLSKLIKEDCLCDERCRQVIAALVWTNHTSEALVVFLLMLFPTTRGSTRERRQKFVNTMLPLCQGQANSVVTQKLLLGAMEVA